MRWLALLLLLVGCESPAGLHCRPLPDSLIVAPPQATVTVEVCQ